MSTTINALNLRSFIPGTEGKDPVWKPGQLLHATLLKSIEPGLSLLKVGDTLIQAKLSEQFRVGDKLLLELMKSGPKPVLQVYLPATATSSSKAVISDTIKLNIAKQNSVTLLLNTIQTLVKQTSSFDKLPTELRQLLKQLLTQSPRLDTLKTATGFKRAFQHSGIFLEQQLLTRQHSRPNHLSDFLRLDVKASLLKLKHSLSALSKDTAPMTKTSLENLKNANQYMEHKSTPPQKLPSNPQTGSNTLKQPTLIVQTRLLGSEIQSTPHKINQGLPNYNLPSFSTAAKNLDLKPLLRSSNPHPAGSHKNLFRMTASQLPATTQGLLQLLFKMVESALARITISQLNSAPVDTDNKQVWLFDVPIAKDDEKNHDLVQARVEVDKDEDENQDRLWTVQLALDLPELGPLQSRITIHGDQVETLFHSSHPDQQKLIEEHINLLRDSLTNAGLQVKKLGCTQGLQESPIVDFNALLDEKA